MKQLTIILIIVFQLIGLNSQAQVTHYIWGNVVDNFTVTDTDGNKHTLYDYTAQGKYVYLDFFFAACGPCKILSPIYNEFYDKYGCNNGDIICLSIDHFDNNAQVEAYEATYGGSYHHAPACSAIEGGGDAVVANFGVEGFPTICVINPENKIINLSIWPHSSVADIEASFINFTPQPMNCTTGIEKEHPDNINFNIFPNPAKEEISIRTKQAVKTISIYSISGQRLFSTNYKEEIKISNLASGIYIIELMGKNGEIEHSKLFKN